MTSSGYDSGTGGRDGAERAQADLDDVMSAPDGPEVHKDRRVHGGMPRVEDDELAERTEQERVAAGLDAVDPDAVPAATDEPPEGDVTTGEVYQDALREVHRETDAGLLPSEEGGPTEFPPSRYPDA